MAWIPTTDIADAQGELLETYRALMSRPLPAVYQPMHGGAPGIIRAHSLDPALMRAVFGASGALHKGPLPSAEYELVAAVTSRAGQCLY
ncbi:hypothetical protein [Chondromyces crocatus]|uniref:Carboxymuconolactone decarboxylase-like domain-containing protein n=1 Tax=Chondromyces crocatus TaxID=52 RepID=A0A0K1ESV2_CHOCO|nr:hypothetical protein [Chondromyces crocatus]AKT44015.1 uncharacterized protein CMC5_082530 [Chondromyces crocatus]